MRHARDDAHQPHDAGSQVQHARIGEELPGQLFADVLLIGHARHDHTGRGGDHQRRDLRHQAIADGQQRVVVHGGAEVQVVLHHAHHHAGGDVDEHDDQARHGVAAHELAGTVHGAVEVGFLRHFGAALLGGGFVDQAGVEVGIDRHLLAGHRVQHEARAHLGDTARALGDDHEVDHDQDREHHDTDREVAAHQEVAEGFHHLAGGVGAGMAFEQHHAGGCDVQRQAQQRGKQQHRGEGGEVQRLLRVHADQQHHDRQRDIEGKQQVQHEGRQRQDHHPQDHDDQQRPGEGLHLAGRAQARQVHQRAQSIHSRLSGTASSSGTSRSDGACGCGPCE
ncbi:hypothetical protein D3C81_1180290 [compost metagenome]